MLRNVVIGILSLAVVLWAQKNTKIDTTVHEKDMQWNTYPSEEPVKAFAVSGNTLWYAAGEAVIALDMRKMGMEKFLKVGSVSAAGVTTMTSDATGKIWMGTPEGLAVRDGKGFSTFTTEKGLPDNGITRVSASGSKVAVATKKGGAVYTGSWKTYRTTDGLAGDDVRDVMIDNSGRVWFGTDKGISCYDGTSWTSHNMKKGMSWNDTKALGYDSRTNTVWAAVGESDINSYDGKKWHVYMAIQEGISSIMVDTQSRVWFGSPSGLVKFNGDEWISDPKTLGITAGPVSSTFRDGQGNMWFGTSLGVMRLANPYPF